VRTLTPSTSFSNPQTLNLKFQTQTLKHSTLKREHRSRLCRKAIGSRVRATALAVVVNGQESASLSSREVSS